jgi:lipopolysaccharide/colanic/teichoic acid biosynthesis glycosyltransferase
MKEPILKAYSLIKEKFRRKNLLCGIYSLNEFRAVVEHERARSDRTGSRFCVVVFKVGDFEEDLSNACFLPDALTQRVRSSDVVGWFDEQQVGVLLPDTTPEGAAEFAEKAFQSAVGIPAPPARQIYTYPSGYLDGEEDDNNSCAYLNGDRRKTKLFKWKESPKETGGKKEETDSKKDMAEVNPDCKNYAAGLESQLGLKIPRWKRLFDVLSVGVGLIILSPLFLFVVGVIKTVSPGPIFFKQKRVGYLGRQFDFWKFRTMKSGSDSGVHENYVRNLMKDGTPMKKIQKDPRIIPFGAFFRKAGIDELPQLINVLIGEMSLVGPRPCLPYEYEEYFHWHKRRFYTLPGLTGLWQVSGKNRLTFSEMIRLDIKYEQKRSLGMDLKIILKTFPAVMMLMTEA